MFRCTQADYCEAPNRVPRRQSLGFSEDVSIVRLVLRQPLPQHEHRVESVGNNHSRNFVEIYLEKIVPGIRPTAIIVLNLHQYLSRLSRNTQRCMRLMVLIVPGSSICGRVEWSWRYEFLRSAFLAISCRQMYFFSKSLYRVVRASFILTIASFSICFCSNFFCNRSIRQIRRPTSDVWSSTAHNQDPAQHHTAQDRWALSSWCSLEHRSNNY